MRNAYMNGKSVNTLTDYKCYCFSLGIDSIAWLEII